MQRYLFTWLLATVLILIGIATFNLVVDPYGVFRLVDTPGFNSVKPAAPSRGPLTKAIQVLRVRPQTLILGNSRAELGLDPNHPAWPQNAKPVYNAALPGTGTATSLRYLQHVLAANAGNPSALPKRVVWGVDFMDFLTDPKKPMVPRAAHPVDAESRRLKFSTAADRMNQNVRDYAESTLTLAALMDSVQTLASQRNPYAVDLTPQGFNPMRDYLKITADEGYWSVFQQKDQANTIAYLRRPKSILSAGGLTSEPLEDFKQVLSLCRQHGITLQLFIYPYHAHLQEIIRVTGLWPTFENWKSALTQLLAQEAMASGSEAYELWDFSGFNALTSETIPDKSDHRATMRWYWEGGHFKSELGGRMLERMLASGPQNSDFGVLLTPTNVAKQNAALRAQEEDYRSGHAQEVEEIVRFAAQRVAKQSIK